MYYQSSVLAEPDRTHCSRKQSGFGGRLLKAQEEERAHIARELHDSITQSLAILQIRIKTLERDASAFGLLQNQLHELENMCAAISQEVRSLSHRLHSSKLEILGLSTAVRSFCNELAASQNAQIELDLENIPRSVPCELSLSLFRVLQEALHNAIKYSGVRTFRVRLRSTPSDIRLSVHDSGVGFDVAEAMSGTGLGLVCMRERAQLLGGTLKIRSGICKGTTVEVRVPFINRSVLMLD
jgi:signal transduction histidine kinase